MDINGWLTIVTVFLALIALLPQHERNILLLKLGKVNLWLIVLILFVLIPYLIFFQKLAYRISFLTHFTHPDGLDPLNLAFGLCYLGFLWIILNVYVFSPTDVFYERVIQYYRSIIDEMPFPQFFSLFVKFCAPSRNTNEWMLYKPLILSPTFLKGIQQYQPNYIFSFIKYIDSRADFKSILLPFVKDTGSVYFQEIKDNHRFRVIRRGSPFLQGLIVENLEISLNLHIRQIVSDSAKSHLRQERNKLGSIYLQDHMYGHMVGEEGYDLPLYYHIRFISLLYSTAIQNMVETKDHMHTIYAGMIEGMIKNLGPLYEYPDRELPTNYHWLINEIFSEISDWEELFGTQHFSESKNNEDYAYFRKDSTYIDFIPSCFNFAVKELYKGLEEDKISVAFIARVFHHHLFHYYFRHDARPEILSAIEENVIRNIPGELMDDILDKTLDEHFAGCYNQFIQGHFNGDHREVAVQARLQSYIASNL